ncbi:unnamed protein product [Rhizoctonia solani]|uniref:BTB domain-containing protein n=1 Tax=Rhizoctonia solani TaxID=456999 RepID=A0A8H3B5L0_9AGAM|nr:unnamed protein product [Rhizoctonia solani]
MTLLQNHDSSVRYQSAVFLAGNTLFKFQASLLAPDPNVNDYEFKHMVKHALGDSEGDASNTGTDDAHPIVLPADVTEDQFRDLLMVAFGGVVDRSSVDFFRSLKTPSSYSPTLVSRLTNIGYLGCRFGMKRLDVWSQIQIHAVLQHLVVTRQSADDWGAPVILRLVQYLQNTSLAFSRCKLLDLTRHIISTLVERAYELNNEIPQGTIIDVCAALYKEKDLLINTPEFFGFIFAVIVSLGHQSPIWTNCLTREDRRVLYAANTTLTRLASHADLDVGWVMDPTALKKVCPQCPSGFDASWNKAFSQCDGLKSRVPLEDLRHVVTLPVYRMRFWLANRVAPCKCAVTVMNNIEPRMDTLYSGLTEKYKFLVETV